MANETVTVPELSFPKGGGAIKGMGESLTGGGQSGVAGLNIPLPLSEGRGFAPALSLDYSSSAGNGPFGVGFELSLPAIRRRVSKGVPAYDDSDEFLGPGGDILVPVRDGDIIVKRRRTLNARSYSVVAYRPGTESSFGRLEHWLEEGALSNSFWLWFGPDASVQLFGNGLASRHTGTIEAVDVQGKVLSWLLAESVSVTGEHVFYQYKSENSQGVSLASPVEKSRDHATQRYLKRVLYCNQSASKDLYLLAGDNSALEAALWHMELIFDYGEHQPRPGDKPAYEESGIWPVRQDSFSDFAAGFEVRTHRLCRGVLMFHCFPDELGPLPVLVRQLILEYDESPYLSQLRGASLVAYGPDPASASQEDVPIFTPPIDLEFSGFDLTDVRFEPYAALQGIDSAAPFQLVDVGGEGLPGVLYRDGSSYLYRAPCRHESSTDPDAVAYGPWQPLPELPSGGLAERGHRALVDVTGTGHLDWVISLPGHAGFFSLGSDGTWQQFTPFSAFPTEFLAMAAQLVDISSNGFPDLALIGPHSVRIYANRREAGFAAPVDVAHGPDALPLFDAARTELVAFSDVLGSGQSHLVRVRADRLECWPNLGRGRFGSPMTLAVLPFDAVSFDPQRVHLADLDGTGANDLLYVESDRLLIFRNRCGNGFDDPVEVRFPDEMRYDRFCRVQFADLFGMGCATMIFTCPHMQVRHWACRFSRNGKPYLLTRMSNNLGMSAQLDYRSSAQEWLDEKREGAGACFLPFPVQVVSRQLTFDEVNRQTLTQCFRYRKGFHDLQEREYRGFGLVIHRDNESSSQPLEDEADPFIATLETRTWYRVGADFDESRLGFNRSDARMWELGPLRMVDERDRLLDADQSPVLWKHARRSLRARIRRQESYSLDAGSLSEFPYRVSEYRYQVRVIHSGESPVVLPLPLEEIHWVYERNPADPMCTHQVVLESDRYGFAVCTANIHYPRRAGPSSPAEYNDSQQHVLWIHRTEEKWIHLDQEADALRLGLPCEQKKYARDWPQARAFSGLLSFEVLAGADGPWKDGFGELGSWLRYFYSKDGVALASGQATAEGLLSHCHEAEITPEALSEYCRDFISGEEASALMEQGRYLLEDGLYWRPGPRSHYLPLNGFYRLCKQVDSWGETRIDYDQARLFAVEVTDALGQAQRAEHDYRVLRPWRLVDPNGNIQEISLDALGRPRVSSFHGTEEGRSVGFDPVQSHVTSPDSCDDAIDRPAQAIGRMAAAYFHEPWSWMGRMSADFLRQHGLKNSEELLKTLKSLGLLDSEAHVRSLHWTEQRLSRFTDGEQQGLKQALAAVRRAPVHSVTLLHDRYPDDPKRQIRCTLLRCDGFGRDLQSKQRVEPGPCYQVDEQGAFMVEDGRLPEAESQERWLVSGRVEYSWKALPVRVYRPYFVNTRAYVDDAAFRQHAPHDSMFYDGMGRVVRTLNAAGDETRTRYGVWFDIHEDENDVWASRQ
ncbi:toxin [Xylophilus rhododendri]|uniref:Toxin n=1 Tax=Xylophilus rhododendri TaxID=2697032 RepID=A0A857J0M4_9BURK|nr:SpvB/TcaC N-terminal domain-containing protein [Xylophilus rhododendri]QHI96823.1 toxin [Xylophilus rhododendri]